MKISQKTIDILKSMKDINPSINIRSGYVPDYVALRGPTVLGVLSTSKKIMGFVKIDEEFEHDVTIFDSGKFLTAMSLFKDADIEISSTHATITSHESSMDFVFCSPEAIVSPPETWATKPTYDAGSFILTSSHISEVLKASSILGAPDIFFEGDGSVVRVKATDIENPSSHKYEAIIDNCDVEFRTRFKVDVLKLFPSNYEVSMVPGSAVKPLRFHNDTMEFFLAPESK